MAVRSGPPPRQQVRVIAGEWRGRKIDFPERPDLRPTPDRVRETLFNWLAVSIPGARCLDLFAGSGALGIEALSRGASFCDFVDTDSEVVRCLRQSLERFHAADRAEVHQGLAEDMADCGRSWDIVFVDPPYRAGLAIPMLSTLHNHRCLTPHALVYLESAREDDTAIPHQLFEVHREKTAGDVRFRLLAPIFAGE